jgi:hypothetical protein
VGFVFGPVSGVGLIFASRRLVQWDIVSSVSVPILVGCALVAGGLSMAAVGIRCRKCKTRLFWRAMNERGNPGQSLLDLQECPVCGDRADGQAMHDEPRRRRPS